MKRSVAILLFALFVMSCQGERGEQPSDESTAVLRLQLEGSSTRAGKTHEAGDADGSYNENLIQDIRVLFYQGEQQVWAPAVTFSAPEMRVELPMAASPLQEGVRYEVCVFANLPPTHRSLSGLTLTQLKEEMLTLPLKASNGKSVLPKIPMAGSLELDYSTALSDFGTVQMSRRLAKVRIAVFHLSNFGAEERQKLLPKGIASDDTFWGVPQLVVTGLAGSGHLVANNSIGILGKFETDSHIPLSKKAVDEENGEYFTHEYPIYSFPLKLDRDDLSPPSWTVRIPYYHGTADDPPQSEATYYYYTGTIVSSSSVHGTGELRGNFLYEVQINIERLGSTLPQDPVLLEGNVINISTWDGEKRVSVEVSGQHFLHLSPLESDIYKSEFAFNYSSSLPLKLEDIHLSGKYIYFDKAFGEEIEATLNDSDLGTIRLDETKGRIIINKPLPNNNVIHRMTLEVSVGSGTQRITRTARFDHIPNVVVSAEKTSIFSPDENPNMYIFRTSRADATFLQQYKIGYPNALAPTSDDNDMISPHFQVSSYNVGGRDPRVLTYEEAVEKVNNYTETSISGRIYDDWRLPTLAELVLIDRITDQDGGVTEGQSILKEAPDSYWSLYNPSDSRAKNKRLRYVRDIR